MFYFKIIKEFKLFKKNNLLILLNQIIDNISNFKN